MRTCDKCGGTFPDGDGCGRCLRELSEKANNHQPLTDEQKKLKGEILDLLNEYTPYEFEITSAQAFEAQQKVNKLIIAYDSAKDEEIKRLREEKAIVVDGNVARQLVIEHLTKEVEELKDNQGVKPIIIDAVGVDYDSIPFSTATYTYEYCELCRNVLLNGKCLDPLCNSKNYEPNDLI